MPNDLLVIRAFFCAILQPAKSLNLAYVIPISLSHKLCTVILQFQESGLTELATVVSNASNTSLSYKLVLYVKLISRIGDQLWPTLLLIRSFLN